MIYLRKLSQLLNFMYVDDVLLNRVIYTNVDCEILKKDIATNRQTVGK